MVAAGCYIGGDTRMRDFFPPQCTEQGRREGAVLLTYSGIPPSWSKTGHLKGGAVSAWVACKINLEKHSCPIEQYLSKKTTVNNWFLSFVK